MSKKYTYAELINKSKIDRNKIVGAMNSKQFKDYCNELLDKSYNHRMKPVITEKEFDKILKKIKEE